MADSPTCRNCAKRPNCRIATQGSGPLQVFARPRYSADRGGPGIAPTGQKPYMPMPMACGGSAWEEIPMSQRGPTATFGALDRPKVFDAQVIDKDGLPGNKGLPK